MADKSIDYAQLSNELDQIIMQMQDEQTSIDESIKLYERGAKIIKELNVYLSLSENKIKQISGTGKDK